MQKLICIDLGHGGADNGASYGFIDEDDINLPIGFYLDYELRLLGIKTVLTREKDEEFSLYQRSALSNIKRPDLFVSIHCDAFHSETVSGMSIHVHPKASLNTHMAAVQIEKQLKTQFPDHLYRGVKQSNFHVLRETKAPALLIECEFLSNPTTRNFLKEAENQRKLARALKTGIINYLGQINRVKE